jgi:NAD(P)H-dependent FMN reductase
LDEAVVDGVGYDDCVVGEWQRRQGSDEVTVILFWKGIRMSILVIAGTMRVGSMSLKVSRQLELEYRAAGVGCEVLALETMPAEAFVPGVYGSKPAWVVRKQEQVLAARGLHVVTPEYNGSFPGVLKHFIDLLKFPESFEGKPVAFTGVAAGVFGALRSVEQLQMIFAYRNAYLYPARVFIPQVHTKMNEAGQIADVEIARRLGEQARGFDAFVRSLGK